MPARDDDEKRKRAPKGSGTSARGAAAGKAKPGRAPARSGGRKPGGGTSNERDYRKLGAGSGRGKAGKAAGKKTTRTFDGKPAAKGGGKHAARKAAGTGARKSATTRKSATGKAGFSKSPPSTARGASSRATTRSGPGSRSTSTGRSSSARSDRDDEESTPRTPGPRPARGGAQRGDSRNDSRSDSRGRSSDRPDRGAGRERGPIEGPFGPATPTRARPVPKNDARLRDDARQAADKPARSARVRSGAAPAREGKPAPRTRKASARKPKSDVGVTASKRRARRPKQTEARDEILRIGGRRGARNYETLLTAAEDFRADRARDAVRLLTPLASEMPDAASVRELLGLSLYRLGRWSAAAKELTAFVELTDSVEQHPVLMDCERALGHHAAVAVLWRELGEASPNSELVAEGRIVMAGDLADQGRIQDAISLLERRGARSLKSPKDHHLRVWYALADLHERAGDVPAARELFRRVMTAEAGFADVAERLAALG